jgi:hypothetical protein
MSAEYFAAGSLDYAWLFSLSQIKDLSIEFKEAIGKP